MATLRSVISLKASLAGMIDDSGRGAVEAPAAGLNGLLPGNPFGECVNEHESGFNLAGEALAAAAIPGGSGGKLFSRGVRNAFRRTVMNLSRDGASSLSPQKLAQLTRVASKLGGEVTAIHVGERGRGGIAHVHVTGLGSKIRARHIPVRR